MSKKYEVFNVQKSKRDGELIAFRPYRFGMELYESAEGKVYFLPRGCTSVQTGLIVATVEKEAEKYGVLSNVEQLTVFEPISSSHHKSILCNLPSVLKQPSKIELMNFVYSRIDFSHFRAEFYDSGVVIHNTDDDKATFWFSLSGELNYIYISGAADSIPSGRSFCTLGELMQQLTVQIPQDVFGYICSNKSLLEGTAKIKFCEMEGDSFLVLESGRGPWDYNTIVFECDGIVSSFQVKSVSATVLEEHDFFEYFMGESKSDFIGRFEVFPSTLKGIIKVSCLSIPNCYTGEDRRVLQMAVEENIVSIETIPNMGLHCITLNATWSWFNSIIAFTDDEIDTLIQIVNWANSTAKKALKGKVRI